MAVDNRPAGLRFRKRSDLVAEEIKGWIVTRELPPGSRLPQERELISLFGVSKGTIREALKSLEVQGLVHISPGPNGGATLKEVEEEHAMQLLGNFFYFRPLTAGQIYEARKVLEPEMAATVVDHLTEHHFAELERIVGLCSPPATSPEERRRQRVLDLDFHDVLAGAHPNAWLSFLSRFMNRLLRDIVVFRKIYLDERDEFGRCNLRAHDALLAAFRRRDRDAVHRIMSEHMHDAERHMTELEGVLQKRYFLQPHGHEG